MSKREFELVEGPSNKFWTIEVTGNSYTVSYGRIGTDGQTKEKSFDSEAAAEASAEKLAASKVKKGYLEIRGDGQAKTTSATPVTKKKSAKKPPQKKLTKASPPVPAEIGPPRREINIAPYWTSIITWQDAPTLKRPASPKFDLEDGLKRLRSLGKSTLWIDHKWHKAEVSHFPSPPEAQFWLRAHQELSKDEETPLEVANAIAEETFDGSMTNAQVIEAAKKPLMGSPEILFGCVVSLLNLEELVDFLIEEYASDHPSCLNQFIKHVLPYLTEEERRIMRDRVRPKITPVIPGDLNKPFPIHYYFGALLGCHTEIEAVLNKIPDDHYKGNVWVYTHYQNPQFLIFGLPSRRQIIDQFRRLRLRLRSNEEIFSWLALTGLEALDFISTSITFEAAKREAAALAETIHCVVAPEMALPALEVATNSKAPQIGMEWLHKNTLEAIVGLVPHARGTSHLAQAARNHLHVTRRAGQQRFLKAAKEHLESEDASWLQREILENEEALLAEIAREDLPGALPTLFDEAQSAKLPTWVQPAVLPPLKINGKRLAQPELASLILTLKATPLPDKSPLLATLRKHAEPTSRDHFAWSFFEHWIQMGSVSKDKWAMGTIGHLGGDECVLQLTPLVRQWPGESQHQRAAFGLECLRAINSESALVALNGIALKLKYKALKEKARSAMEEIAKDRDMTRDQLADRIVPDCGLDQNGTRIFDFGPRQFRFVLGGESKPMVRDSAGKLRVNLPKPNKSDDPEKPQTALTEWKALKKTLRETLKVQGERLETAMITGRRWSSQDFRTFLIDHPFMVNLVRQIILAAYDEKGKMTHTFRITEDRTIADQEEEDLAYPSSGSIGVVHPAHLPQPTLSAWGEVLADYAIVPPFPQLGRTISRPDPDDLKATSITRFKGLKVPGITLYGMLERSHWSRDTPADAGGFMQHSNYFEACHLTAFIAYEPGMSIGSYDEDQEISEIYFVKGHIVPDYWGHHPDRLKIGDVDEVVISEVLRIANAITAKA